MTQLHALVAALILAPVLTGCSTIRSLGSGGMTVEQALRKTAHIQLELEEEYGVMDASLKLPDLPTRLQGFAFRRPLDVVRLTSRFGKRWGSFHAGIDCQARTGTPVYAVFGGVVVFSDDRIRGYGDTVVLRHVRGLSTVYAHNSVLLVREGDRVIRGQRIALSGESGRASGPHVHFEVRDGEKAIDPLKFFSSIDAMH
jgi:murein DD-endopeptidase MepM/ murein hydrolase activator NlpD